MRWGFTKLRNWWFTPFATGWLIFREPPFFSWQIDGSRIASELALAGGILSPGHASYLSRIPLG
jgi:hypothetical protein